MSASRCQSSGNEPVQVQSARNRDHGSHSHRRRSRRAPTGPRPRLTGDGHEVEEASNGNAAIERLHDGYFDVVLSDLKMGGSDGMDVLRTTRALHPTTAVILMTAFGSVNTAVEAMKIGAFDYIQKPFEIEEMEVKIEKALEMRRLKNELDYLRGTQQDIYDFDRIVGSSPSAAAGARHRQEGRQEQHDGAHPRRDGHGQGARRAARSTTTRSATRATS